MNWALCWTGNVELIYAPSKRESAVQDPSPGPSAVKAIKERKEEQKIADHIIPCNYAQIA